jgi:hypothetical protein
MANREPQGSIHMLLAKVVGTVVSTKKEQSMTGLRFMLVQPVDVDAKPAGAHVVAVDAVGSGPANAPATPSSWPSWTTGRSPVGSDTARARAINNRSFPLGTGRYESEQERRPGECPCLG